MNGTRPTLGRREFGIQSFGPFQASATTKFDGKGILLTFFSGFFVIHVSTLY